VLLQVGDPANIELVRQLVQAHAYWPAQGTGGGPGDLERGPCRVSAAPPRANPGADRGRHRAQRDGSAGRHLRPACRPDLKRGSHPAPNRRAGHPQATRGERWRSRSPRAARAKRPFRPGRPSACTGAIARRSRTASSGSPLPSTGWAIYRRWPRVCHHDGGWARHPVPVGECSGESGVGPSLPRAARPTRGARMRTNPPHPMAQTDPVSDCQREAVYLRDDRERAGWSPTPLPSRGTSPYAPGTDSDTVCSEHTEVGIRSSCGYVAWTPRFKFSV